MWDIIARCYEYQEHVNDTDTLTWLTMIYKHDEWVNLIFSSQLNITWGILFSA